MTTLTIASICQNIADELADLTGFKAVSDYSEITESIPPTDLPLLQVYPEAYDPDPARPTERTAFQGNVKWQRLVVHLDHYPQQRSQMGEDFSAMVEGLDTIEQALSNQQTPPFFSTSGIKSFDWSWSRKIFRYSTSLYVGGRFVLVLWIG